QAHQAQQATNFSLSFKSGSLWAAAFISVPISSPSKSSPLNSRTENSTIALPSLQLILSYSFLTSGMLIYGQHLNCKGMTMTVGQTFRNTLVVIITVVAAYALWMSVHILIVLFLAIIIASAMRPSVLWIQARGISQSLSILAV